ncbi:pimeloyl-ACP methyl ester carboxylesterase [Herbaspirillum sp. Sphag1AN]|uniref:alpha/beta fold hydrolase n=1 Tax=unclassified Herbaspirillum TaxID=2624150 RepID=UPI00160C389B|nr:MULTISPECIES: alpha/beta hydrolase [unclassified Herbaspirillum]MBB3211259.1 pimeloyl-ACP methyl ester carboxylesterase [Herbaspirillum sp. Sphag1AN]MBB3244888.1 pimeloyl-ACP methyl ester carboxylesterase [Herbaspirillum sp. Sphag64]
MKPSRSEFLTIRSLRYHVRHWGQPGAPKLFMMHGWMDMSASFQFMVDHLQRDWHVIAPDWRGFGLTDRPQADTYWHPDYLADLDAILKHYAPEEAVNLLGHSMGANIVAMYAGVRPHRIARLVNLEGFGLPTTKPQQAPGRYAKWLDELQSSPELRTYSALEGVIARLKKTNPRLSNERATFLAAHWSRQNDEGQWEILGDPAHKNVNPILYHVDEVTACWQQITAPVLWVEAEHTDIWRWFGENALAREEIDRRMTYLGDVRVEMIPEAGHMLHHDQPELLAATVERFLLA